MTATQTMNNIALSALSYNKVTITAPATSSTITVADGKTLTASNTLTLTGTDSSSIALGAGGTVIYQNGSPSFGGLTILGGVLTFQSSGNILSAAAQTTNATPTILVGVVVAQNAGYSFKGTVTGTKSDGSAVVGGSFELQVRRPNGGNVTAETGLPIYINGTAGFAATFSVGVDTGSQIFAITVTGVAATTINWTCLFTQN